EDLCNPGGDLLRGEAIERAEVGHHLSCGHSLVERGQAGQIADMLTHLLRLRPHIESCNGSLPGGGLEDGGEHSHQGGFTRSVGTEYSKDLSRMTGEGDAFHRPNLTAFFVMKGLAELLDFYHFLFDVSAPIQKLLRLWQATRIAFYVFGATPPS